MRPSSTSPRRASYPETITNHSFRGSRITEYLRAGGTLETAARIAGHASTSTTPLYDRTDEAITLDEIERIHIKPTIRNEDAMNRYDREDDELLASKSIDRHYVIREATASDADSVAAAHVASWRVAYRDLMPASMLRSLDTY